MFIANPNDILRISQNDDDFVLKMGQDWRRHLFKIQNVILSEKACLQACELIQDQIGLTIWPDLLKSILGLYPEARIKIAEADGVGDTDVNDALFDAIAHFFLGCSWPINRDNVDIRAFEKLLVEQATAFIKTLN